MTPQEIAERSAQAMWANDKASRALGMELVEVAPGYAQMTMTIRRDMLNGQDIGHGGLIFTLADSTFAFACNTYNQKVVAQNCGVTFHAPAMEGDVLTATGTEVTRAGRSGLYDIFVKRADGTLVASFRGHSRTVPGTHFEAD
ncbi:hydroxyphenylacetyl-CoA thioesterase PaaI [Tranquillimonas alkanivorans]|uniref:Acyl-CoA thioesterase n=1 Tax=Tranquillimonas alkanivorans TaxID=441119 RepID=A0A1I5S7A5_9RHOB|nr:hydroxyphenylacetyl-CoA thioesterase PaaI [Tranquillimonas alkanivorans]SFP66678.1 acyl-CoA thioesterase [Tranquillimonas alkanivorans]